jgi:hypothetical protein
MAPSRRISQRPSAQREIDDGGGQRVAGGTAVDDQRNAVADLVADAGARGALRRPCRLAEVAVMGSPKRSTTARGIAASGTRRATLPVLAVERSGSLVPARTMMVSGPGQKRSASLSSSGSVSRASS